MLKNESLLTTMNLLSIKYLTNECASHRQKCIKWCMQIYMPQIFKLVYRCTSTWIIRIRVLHNVYSKGDIYRIMTDYNQLQALATERFWDSYTFCGSYTSRFIYHMYSSLPTKVLVCSSHRSALKLNSSCGWREWTMTHTSCINILNSCYSFPWNFWLVLICMRTLLTATATSNCWTVPAMSHTGKWMSQVEISLWLCVLTLPFGWGLASLPMVECPTRILSWVGWRTMERSCFR